MATYKVIQDIEADDKLLGPLTLRQFVYAGIAAFCLWICYFLVAHGATFLTLAVLPFLIVAVFFAIPWSKEQPTELWALARISFLIKPRIRIWDQSGVRQLVTITVPKRAEHIYSDGLSEIEVKSRLTALAETIDSRGWAIKNAAAGSPYVTPVIATANPGERLIDPAFIPQEVPADGKDTFADVLDPATSQTAQHFDSLLTAKAQEQHQRLQAAMEHPAPRPRAADPVSQTPAKQPADYWFLNQPSSQDIPAGNQVFGTQVVTPGDPGQALIPTASDDDNIDEKALTEALRSRSHPRVESSSHLPTILPIAEQKQRAKAEAEATAAAEAARAEAARQQAAMTAVPDPVILELADNDDLNIATIARQANKKRNRDDSDANEVVISLH